MNQLYPIVRRTRRVLWPGEEPQKETNVAAVEAQHKNRTDCERSALTLDPSPPREGEASSPVREAVAASETGEAVIDQSLLTSAPTQQVETSSFALATEAAPVELKPKKVRRRGNAPE